MNNKVNSFRSIKPSKGILKKILVHRQYHEFGDLTLEGEEREIMSSEIDNNTCVTLVESCSKGDDNQHVQYPISNTSNSNVIVFDQNIHASREITHPNNAFLREQRIDPSAPLDDPRQSATTVVNISPT